MSDSELLNLIRKVKAGELSVEEASSQMAYLEAAHDPDQAGAVPVADYSQAQPAAELYTDEFEPLELGWWRYAWMIPLGIGILVLVLSALLLSWAYMNERLFWFYCSWLPLLLGLLILTLGIWSRQARWAHVRIRSSDGTRISVSTPLPVRFAGWALRFLSPFIPALKDKHFDTLPDILDALDSSKDPIFVDVDDGGGDHVRVYIL